jgi:hypothetical protein
MKLEASKRKRKHMWNQTQYSYVGEVNDLNSDLYQVFSRTGRLITLTN